MAENPFAQFTPAPVEAANPFSKYSATTPTSEIPAPRQSWDDTAYNAAINLIPSMGGQVVQASKSSK